LTVSLVGRLEIRCLGLLTEQLKYHIGLTKPNKKPSYR